MSSIARSRVALTVAGQLIGYTLRTRENVKPLFVSVGHRLSPQDACSLTLQYCSGYRLPLPTHVADRYCTRFRKTGEEPEVE